MKEKNILVCGIETLDIDKVGGLDSIFKEFGLKLNFLFFPIPLYIPTPSEIFYLGKCKKEKYLKCSKKYRYCFHCMYRIFELLKTVYKKLQKVDIDYGLILTKHNILFPKLSISEKTYTFSGGFVFGNLIFSKEELLKTIFQHEFLHLIGLNHCKKKKCIMFKTLKFQTKICKKCSKAIKDKIKNDFK